ncbi:MAG: glycoside hydrolase [Actinomycetota bacterium]|nr:glycoside hydrolase [Actinomycetota bacterium]
MRRTVLAGIAAAVGLVVVIVAVAALTSGGSTKVGDTVLVNREGPIDVRNSPTIARNPTRGDNLVVTYRMDRPGFSGFLSYSDNGGRTWEQTVLPLAPDVPKCAASPQGDPCPFGPDVAFGPDGTLYVLYVALRGTGNDPGSLWLSTSTDGGHTLALPTMVSGELAFQARLAIDPKGPVHITWLQAFGTGNLSFTEPVPYVVAVRSDDKGKTFSAPVRVSDPARERIGAPSPVVDGKGRLQVLYTDYKDNQRDFSDLPGPPAELPFALVLATSTDGGKTFGPNTEVDADVLPTRRFLIYLPEFPQLAAGSGDNLYATWADGRNGDDDVFLRHSSDGGGSWSKPVKVNDNPADGTAQFLPKVDVAPDGRVDVLFLDGRNDPAKVLLDAYLATSDDHGKTFRNIRMSAQSFDSTVGPSFGTEYGTDFGTKLGLMSTDDRAYAVWTDTHLGTPATGRQDVAFTSVALGSSRGGVAVALVVILLLLIGASTVFLVRSRRTKAAPARPADNARVPGPRVPGR